MSLRSLSDREILSRIHELIRRERSLTLAVLLHLNEIERRRLHLKSGHASMFDYCTTGLGYSASAASRRIRTARCVARFPQVYALLESNQVNVSTVAQVSRVLTPGNKDEILSRIRGKSQREVEAIVAEYEPLGSAPKDRVRTVVVRVPVGATAAAGGAARVDCGLPTPTATQDATESDHNRNGCAADTLAVRPACEGGVDAAAKPNDHNRNGCNPVPHGAAKLERRALIQFSASEAFMAKLEQVRSLAWHRLPVNASLEEVFELALDVYIEKQDPRARDQRRRKKEQPAQTLAPRQAAPSAQQDSLQREDSPQRARYVPPPLRDRVFARDGGRCTYTSAGGRRCGSTSGLQIDHITPVARGGDATAGNLRLLCAYHNRLEAERILGMARPGQPPD